MSNKINLFLLFQTRLPSKSLSRESMYDEIHYRAIKDIFRYVIREKGKEENGLKSIDDFAGSLIHRFFSNNISENILNCSIVNFIIHTFS